MTMPWTRARAIAAALRGHGTFPEGYTGSRTIPELTTLFDACFRLQREASQAAGRHIPLVVENVKGAQPWVGRAAGHYGSYYLWGDLPTLMPSTHGRKDGNKGQCGAWFNDYRQRRECGGLIERLSCTSSHSKARKEASARIAMIPFPLARWIGEVFIGA